MRATLLHCLAGVCLSMLPCVSSAALQAGAATSNITPELGEAIIGGFAPFPSTHVHDELHARCLVLDDGKTKLALVVCDLLGLHRTVSVEARRLITEATGIPASHVAISATHTHSASSVIGSIPRSYSSDLVPQGTPLSGYPSFVARRIADGVRRAMNELRPAELAFGTVDIPEHVHNRRWHMKEGTAPVNPFGKVDQVKMNPGSGANLVQPAGPIDPTVSVIALREAGAGPLISLYSAYSLHYVGGVGPGHISADYYGMYCQALARRVEKSSPRFIAMMANGTSGDINNIDFKNPRPSRKPYEQMKHVAEDLADKVHQLLPHLRWITEAPLSARYRELGIAWRKIEPKLLDWAKETSAKAPRIQGKTDLSAIYAQRVMKLAEASPETKAPVQTLRIGDICIGTTPVETFAEIGLEFKQRSPFPGKSFIIEIAHGYYGYMPTARHFPLGGYETWPGTNNLEPQAAEKMMYALLSMAAEMQAE
jgi:neutral ceramidase